MKKVYLKIADGKVIHHSWKPFDGSNLEINLTNADAGRLRTESDWIKNGEVWEVISAEGIAARELLIHRTNKRAEVNAERLRLNDEPLAYNGEFFDVDNEGGGNFKDAIERISLPNAKATRMWTTADNSANSHVSLNHDDIRAIEAARIDRKDIVNQAGDYIKNQISESDNAASMDIPSLYAAKITELLAAQEE